jgi:hypothetical protein
MGMDTNDFMAHFTLGISKEIKDYATNEVFLRRRYIFTERQGKKQFGFCTHCRRLSRTDSLKHNSKAKCPNCNSECTVKASGIGHKYLCDQAYFVYYEPSVIDPNAMVAKGILAARDYGYGTDYHYVETKYLETALYLFQMRHSTLFTRYGFYSMANTMVSHEEWHERNKVFSNCDGPGLSLEIIRDCSYDSIARAVAGTPFRYSTWSHTRTAI